MAEVFDRRAALEEAFDSAEADAKGEVYTPPPREPQTEEPQSETTQEETNTEDPGRVETEAAERAAPKERPRTRGVPPDERGSKVAAPKQGETDSNAAATLEPTGKAPLGWGPQREALWAKTPNEVRMAINRREQEIQRGMSQAGRIRQIAEEYHSVISPFENVIKSIGTTPKEALTNVMQTATVMIMGTQAQKCAVLAEMVQRYGVDVKEFDAALTNTFKNKGQPNTNGGGNGPPPIDPRLIQAFKPLFDLQNQLLASQNQRAEQMNFEAATEIGKISDLPHFEDLREDVADIMEYAAKRGRIISTEDAYYKAAEQHPEISKLVTRPTVKAPANKGSKLARARRASSTVQGNPGNAVNGAKATDRRSVIADAFDSQA